MTESLPDPRPLDARPAHWNYREHCWDPRWVWEERVAMSELGIGPENVSQDAEGRVRTIDIEYRTISDRKLAHLAAFPRLTGLSLNQCAFTDGAVEYLVAVPRLSTLWIVGTKITPRGVRRIEKAHPEAMVFTRPGEAAVPGPDGKRVKISRRWFWS